MQFGVGAHVKNWRVSEPSMYRNLVLQKTIRRAPTKSVNLNPFENVSSK